MTKKKELLKNTLIIAFGKISTQMVSFLLLPLYTVFLTPGEFGTYDLILTYIMLLVPTVTLQMEMAVFRFLIDARQDETAKKRIVSNVFQIVGFILLVCFGVYLIFNIFVDVPFAKLILLNAVMILLTNLLLQIARGLGKIVQFAVGSMVTGLTTLVLAIVLVMILRLGVEGLLLVTAAGNLLCTLYLFFALKLYRYIGFKKDKALQKELMHYSFPLVPNGISWWVINVSDRTIISVLIGVAANGIYAVANKYAAIFTSVFGIFAMSWTESASMHIDGKDRDRFFSETINASVRLFGSLGLVLIAALPLVFSFLIDVQYNEAYMYIPVLIIAAFFNAMVGLYSAIYIAKKMTKQVANTSIVAAVINIILTILLMQFIGLWAAALATAIAYLVMTIYRHYDVKKYVIITYEKYLFAVLAAALVVSCGLYYGNTIWGNLVNALIVAVVAVWLNRSIVRVVRDKVMKVTGRKKLTLEQEVYKEQP